MVLGHILLRANSIKNPTCVTAVVEAKAGWCVPAILSGGDYSGWMRLFTEQLFRFSPAEITLHSPAMPVGRPRLLGHVGFGFKTGKVTKSPISKPW
jgi:hypothetical protein